MITLLVILYIVVCFFLILVVLLQQGKGADVAAAFGGATSQSAFGPRGTTTLMHKLTTISFVAFVLLCIGLSVVTARRGRSVTSGLKSRPPASAPAPAKPALPGNPAELPKGAPITNAPISQQPGQPQPQSPPAQAAPNQQPPAQQQAPAEKAPGK